LQDYIKNPVKLLSNHKLHEVY